MDTKLIALYSSHAQCGKSTVAHYLAKRHGFEIIKFAAPLKEMLKTCFKYMGYDDEDIIAQMLEGNLKERPILGFPETTPRHMMQTLGTEWGRELVVEDLWTRIASKRIRHFLDQGIPVVVDDMRFINEYETMEMLGAHMVHLRRPLDVSKTAHASEGALDEMDFDTLIDNIGSISQLEAMALQLTL